MVIEIHENLINEEFSQTSDVSILENTCTYNEFFQNQLLHNRPCIIKDVSKNWNATKYWTENNKPRFKYLRSKYGMCEVTLYDCKEKYYNSQKTKCSTLKEYIDYWIDLKKNQSMPLYYLKDWHLKNQLPSDDFYEVPVYFASDWLNEYLCENERDDYRFVYMGPKSTWTPFHEDVFSSYSWSVNVCGQKRWLLFPPGKEALLRDSLHNVPYDITNTTSDIEHYELVQNAGEAIFIPSGWYHQVWNLKDTISINHNWVNGCNIRKMWLSLESNLGAVKKEIEDCRDMSNYLEHCQIMLKASYGINFEQFYEFIKYIALKRIHFLVSGDRSSLFHCETLGKNHALFDLKHIELVVDLFFHNKDVENLSNINKNEITEILYDIRTCLTKHYII